LKIDWSEKSAKSFGNGILRISLKDVILVAGALIAFGVFWRDTRGGNEDNSREIAKLAKQVANVSVKVDSIQANVDGIERRVFVMETVARVTADIRSRVRDIQNEEIFDPNVSQVKVKRP
jgi:hypothetical protein